MVRHRPAEISSDTEKDVWMVIFLFSLKTQGPLFIYIYNIYIYVKVKKKKSLCLPKGRFSTLNKSIADKFGPTDVSSISVCVDLQFHFT